MYRRARRQGTLKTETGRRDSRKGATDPARARPRDVAETVRQLSAASNDGGAAMDDRQVILCCGCGVVLGAPAPAESIPHACIAANGRALS
jgi:hypothetical protein